MDDFAYKDEEERYKCGDPIQKCKVLEYKEQGGKHAGYSAVKEGWSRGEVASPVQYPGEKGDHKRCDRQEDKDKQEDNRCRDGRDIND